MLTTCCLMLLLGADEKLFEAMPVTPEKAFTGGIEGPACDKEGNIYAVNFDKDHTIGKVTPNGKGEVWVTLPGKSSGNGIVALGKGLYALMGSHTYAEEGAYTISVQVLDDGGSSVSGNLTISVADAPLSSLNIGALAPTEALYYE